MLQNKINFKNRIFGPKPNPFAPWDNNLQISNIGNNHSLILNKYPVQKGHMLLITSNWSPQNGWLTYEDWDALIRVNNDTTGLWFFNSGPKAGASQPHRHIQLLRRFKGQQVCPRDYWFEMLLESKKANNDPLARACKLLKVDMSSSANSKYLYGMYLTLCRQLGLGDPIHDTIPIKPYNLLFTNNWLCLVRRRQESNNGFSINALGFAGYLLATDISNLSWLKVNGPERLIEGVIDSTQLS